MKVKIKTICFDIVWTSGLMHHGIFKETGSGTFSCCLQDRWEDTLLFRASASSRVKAKDAKQQEALAMSEAFRAQFEICTHFEAPIHVGAAGRLAEGASAPPRSLRRSAQADSQNVEAREAKRQSTAKLNGFNLWNE